VKNRSANRLRELSSYKGSFGIEIVFPGFIDHTQLPQLLSMRIGDGNIDLSTLQRHLVP